MNLLRVVVGLAAGVAGLIPAVQLGVDSSGREVQMPLVGAGT